MNIIHVKQKAPILKARMNIQVLR